ncbi:tyrosine-protein phosphatase [Neobacillus vireti]|uniref:tyrosine-protein phosphatase n=1 Tax=Neobacillus vireti TaxID=220686 RepID=UPI0030000A44
MVDIHSHILPGVDDGAQDIAESIKMAKAAVEQGIHTIVATPHHLNNRYENHKKTIIDRVAELNLIFEQEQIDLQVFPGQETRIYGELLEGYELGEILPINQTQYVLIEFSSNHVPQYTEKLFYEMQVRGLIPIIVHPERNQQLIEQPDVLYKLVKNGALSQITAASVHGAFGKKIKKFSQQLIEANLTHFIASDAHNTTSRSFRMREAYGMIQAKYGSEMVYLFKENAALAIEGKYVYKEPPERIKKKKIFNLF